MIDATFMRWPQIPLGEAASRLAVGIPLSRYTAEENDLGDPVRVLQIRDIEDGQVTDPDSAEVIRLHRGRYARFLLDEGDVLISCRGTILKSAYVKALRRPVVASSNFIVVKLNGLVHPAVLVAMTRSNRWKNAVQQRSRSTSGILQLTTKDIADLPVLVLPPTGQQALSDMLDAEAEYRRCARTAIGHRSAMTDRLIDDLIEPHSPSGVAGEP